MEQSSASITPRPLGAAVFAALRRERIARGLAERLDDGICRAVADPAAGTVRVTDPLGHQTLYSPDAQGFIGRVQSPLGRCWTLENDPQGRLLGLTDPAGTRLGLSWDERGRPIAIDRRGADAPGPAWQLDYDGADNLTNLRWPDGTQETLSYPDYAHLGSYTDRAGGSQRFAHDARGRLVAVTDANAAVTRFAYGQWNRPKAVTYPDGRRETYHWRPTPDDASQAQLAAIGDADGPYARIDYRDGRISRITYRDGETVEYTHDPDGRIITAAVDGRPISFRYGANGRLQSETNGTATITYRYDANGSLIAIDGPTGSVGFARDPDLDLVGITDWTGAETPIRHSPDQRQTETRLPNGLTCRETRNAAGKLADLLITVVGRPVHEARYAYDDEDRLTTVEEAGRPPRHHDYDPRGWLAATIEGVSTDPRRRGEINRFDAAGHRVQSAGCRAEYDGAGKVLTNGPHRYGYDARGRLVERCGPDGTWTYRWSDRGLLIEVRNPRHQTITFGYDAFARRSYKQVTDADGRSSTTHFLWAGEQLIAELEQGPDGRQHRDYLWHPGGQALFAMRSDGQVYYSHNDHLGSPRRISDSQGRIVWAADTVPWGQAIMLNEHIRQPWRLPGQYHDPETGLHYNRFRYYDPALGRYLSPDPVGLSGGFDLYAYAGNDPINRSDPSGLWSLGGIANAAASIAVGVVVGVAVAVALIVTAPTTLLVALAAGAAAGIAAGLTANSALNEQTFCLPCVIRSARDAVDVILNALTGDQSPRDLATKRTGSPPKPFAPGSDNGQTATNTPTTASQAANDQQENQGQAATDDSCAKPTEETRKKVQQALIDLGYLADSKGAADGVWGANSKRAMTRFLRRAKTKYRINATTGAPDDCKPSDYFTGEIGSEITIETCAEIRKWQEQEWKAPLGRFELKAITGGNLREDVADAWLAAIRNVETAGGTLGSPYGDTARRLGKAKKVGVSSYSFHIAGRAIDIDQGESRYSKVKETIGGKTYWRIYCRTTKQDGSQGTYYGDPITDKAGGAKPSNAKPALMAWSFTSGKESEAKSGYYIDLTAQLEASGFERIPAHSGWESSSIKTEWWHYQWAADKQPTFQDEVELVGLSEKQLKDADYTNDDMDHTPG